MLKRIKNFNILGIHWKIRFLRGCSQKNNIEGGLTKMRVGLLQFVDLRWGGVGAWQERVGWWFRGRRLLSCFLLTKMCFSLFHFFFVMKYQIIATEYWPIKNQNRWSGISCGTVCVIVLWIISDECVYLFVSCPKLILVSPLRSSWWAQQGFGTRPNYKAPDNLLVELVILLW